MAEPDIPYAHDLMLRTVQHVTVNGEPLASLTVDGTRNLWHRFVQWAFFDDYTGFSATKRFVDVENRFEVTSSSVLPLRAFVTGFFAALATFFSFCVLVVGRPRVLMYTVDKTESEYRSDLRLERLYEVLIKNNIPYTEVIHTVLGKDFIHRFFYRQRLPLYLEGIEWVYFVMRMVRSVVGYHEPEIVIGGLETFSDEEKKIVSATVKKYIGIAPLFSFRHRVLRRILKYSRVRVVFAIDDARHYQEVASAAQDSRIPSYAFQHGQLTPYFMGWLVGPYYKGKYSHPDYFVVWSEYWKKELQALGGVWAESRVIVGGSPKRAIKQSDIVRAKTDAPLRILVPYERDAPPSIINAFITEVCAGGGRVVFKIRADIPKEAQLAGYSFDPKSVSVITQLTELTDPICAVVGTYSTFLYDAVEVLVPVGLLDSPLMHSKRMVTNGVANKVSLGTVLQDIHTLVALSDAELVRRKGLIAAADVFSDTVEGILKSVNLLK